MNLVDIDTEAEINKQQICDLAIQADMTDSYEFGMLCAKPLGDMSFVELDSLSEMLNVDALALLEPASLCSHVARDGHFHWASRTHPTGATQVQNILSLHHALAQADQTSPVISDGALPNRDGKERDDYMQQCVADLDTFMGAAEFSPAQGKLRQIIHAAEMNWGISFFVLNAARADGPLLDVAAVTDSEFPAIFLSNHNRKRELTALCAAAVAAVLRFHDDPQRCFWRMSYHPGLHFDDDPHQIASTAWQIVVPAALRSRLQNKASASSPTFTSPCFDAEDIWQIFQSCQMHISDIADGLRSLYGPAAVDLEVRKMKDIETYLCRSARSSALTYGEFLDVLYAPACPYVSPEFSGRMMQALLDGTMSSGPIVGMFDADGRRVISDWERRAG